MTNERPLPYIGISGVNNLKNNTDPENTSMQYWLMDQFTYAGIENRQDQPNQRQILLGVKAVHKTQYLDIENKYGHEWYPVGEQEFATALDEGGLGALKAAQIYFDPESVADADYRNKFIERICERGKSWINTLQFDLLPWQQNDAMLPFIEEVKQQIKNMYTALVKNSLPLLCVTGYNAKIPVLLGEMKDMLQLDLHGPQNIFEFAEVNESLLPKNSSLVYVVQNYIKEHLEQEICRNTVADYIHMNPDYLDRLFKKEFGLSVSQYIKEKKIDYAKMLLRTTNLSVSEIAQRLGYINLSHFTASFKQITNMTPVNYRKKY